MRRDKLLIACRVSSKTLSILTRFKHFLQPLTLTPDGEHSVPDSPIHQLTRETHILHATATTTHLF